MTPEDRQALILGITLAAQKAKALTAPDSPERAEINKIIRYAKRLYTEQPE